MAVYGSGETGNGVLGLGGGGEENLAVAVFGPKRHPFSLRDMQVETAGLVRVQGRGWSAE